VSNVMTWDEVCRRAGGRRHYNHWRQTIRQLRRLQVLRLLDGYPVFHRGAVRGIARQLNVHPSTICRDIKALNQEFQRCHQCGRFPSVTMGTEDGPDMSDEILADCQAKFVKGEWQWAGRGPLPRNAGDD
jgi:hypothetical protein